MAISDGCQYSVHRCDGSDASLKPTLFKLKKKNSWGTVSVKFSDIKALLRSLKWYNRCLEAEDFGNAEDEFLADLRFYCDIHPLSTLQPKFRIILALDESTPVRRANGRGRQPLPVNLSRQRYNRILTYFCLFRHACNLL